MADIELILQPPNVIELNVDAPDVLQLQVRPPAPIQLSINTGSATYNIEGGLNVVGTANEIDVTIVNQTATVGIANPCTISNVSIDQSLLVDAASTFNDDATFDGIVNLNQQTNANADIVVADGSHLVGDVLGSLTVPCKNTSGVTLVKGTPVYVTGTVGATNTVEVAKATCDTFSTMGAIGVLESTLVNNAFGHVITHGVLSGVDTSGWGVGDEVYVSNVAGNISNTKSYGLTITEPPKGAAISQGPYTQPVIQRIGHVGRVNSNNGEIFIHAGISAEKSNSMMLTDLQDCYIANNGVVTDTYVLMKTGGAGNSVWQDVAASASGFSLTSHTHNQSAFYPVPSTQWNGKSMVWDHVNQIWNYKTMPLAEAYSANQVPVANGSGGWTATSTLPLSLIPSHTHSIEDLTDFKEKKIYLESECNAAGEFSTITVSSGTNVFTTTSLDTDGHFGILDSGAASPGQVAGIGSANGTDSISFGSFKVQTTAVVRIPTLSDGTNTYVVESGFSDNRSGTATDGAYITYSNGINSGKWQGVVYNNGSASTYDLGITVAVNTWYKLQTIVYANRSVEFYVDGVLKATTSSGTAPDGSGSVTRRCGIGTTIRKTLGATSRSIYIDYINLQIDTNR
jgi:hypothetical protein